MIMAVVMTILTVSAVFAAKPATTIDTNTNGCDVTTTVDIAKGRGEANVRAYVLNMLNTEVRLFDRWYSGGEAETISAVSPVDSSMVYIESRRLDGKGALIDSEVLAVPMVCVIG